MLLHNKCQIYISLVLCYKAGIWEIWARRSFRMPVRVCLPNKFSFSADNVREADEESPTKEQSSGSTANLSSDDPSPFPVTGDASRVSPAADSPHHDVLYFVPDYSAPIENGHSSENVNINSRLCTLL